MVTMSDPLMLHDDVLSTHWLLCIHHLHPHGASVQSLHLFDKLSCITHFTSYEKYLRE